MDPISLFNSIVRALAHGHKLTCDAAPFGPQVWRVAGIIVEPHVLHRLRAGRLIAGKRRRGGTMHLSAIGFAYMRGLDVPVAVGSQVFYRDWNVPMMPRTWIPGRGCESGRWVGGRARSHYVIGRVVAARDGLHAEVIRPDGERVPIERPHAGATWKRA